MGKVNYGLGALSLLLGMGLIGVTLYRWGGGLSLGLVLGSLLVLNGIFRWWLARQHSQPRQDRA